jgi:cytochrome c oxidase assembly factor CtaG
MDTASLLSLCLADRTGVTPGTLWSAWSFAPQAVLPLLAALALYAGGLLSARAQGAGPVPAWRAACFAAGWMVLAAALVSPLCRLAATLVSAHMVQHVLLVAVAPVLVALGTPLAAMAAGEPRVPSRPPRVLEITVLYGLAIWLWHFPPAYTLVLLDGTLHTLAYAALIAVSIGFWSSVVRGGMTGDLRCMPALFVTLVHTGLLGALLTFSGRTWYPVLAGGAQSWGLTPLADQQLAGLIMWAPMSAIYLGAALCTVAARLSPAAANR